MDSNPPIKFEAETYSIKLVDIKPMEGYCHEKSIFLVGACRISNKLIKI